MGPLVEPKVAMPLNDMAFIQGKEMGSAGQPPNLKEAIRNCLADPSFHGEKFQWDECGGSCLKLHPTLFFLI
jgi:hypothetical protein